jgi:osmoprotectant transport system permease protein
VNYLLTHGARVAQLTGDHIVLVATALVVAFAIALPLGILAARNPRIGTPLLGVLGAIYTIPSLALLALLVQRIGLGFGSALIALVAYGQFVLVRNISVGLRGVPAAQVDAARGLGFSSLQSLLRVELPLALPTIVAGVRIAAVSMIAIATLAAYVGAGGLGTLIFEGLTFKQPGRILAGSLAAMALAVAADAVLRLVERASVRS